MTDQQKPILVRTTQPVKRYPIDAELGFATPAIADKQLGAGTYVIARYMDGSAYADTPATASPKPLSRMTRGELVIHGIEIGFGDAATFEGNKKQLLEAIQDFAADGGIADALTDPADDPREEE